MPDGQRLEPAQRPRTGVQESLRPALAQPQRQARRSRRSAPRAPRASASASMPASASRASPASSRASSGRKPGVSPASTGKAASSALAEAVDGLDAHAPAGRVEHRANSVRARVLHRRRRAARRAPAGPAPARSAASAPRRRAAALIRCAISAAPALVKVRHRIAAGSTPAQQQPEHARREHLRLARPRRGGQPDVRARVARGALCALRAGERQAHPSRGPGHTIRRAASTGRTRHKARIRAPAWR